MGETRPTVWLNFRDKFDLCFAFLSREDQQKIFKRHTKPTWDKESHQRKMDVDEEPATLDLYTRAIVDWRGLTEKTRRKILVQPLNESSALGVDIPCVKNGSGRMSNESAQLLIQFGNINPKFNLFVMGAIQNFDELYAAEYEEKMTEPSEEEKKDIIEAEIKNS